MSDPAKRDGNRQRQARRREKLRSPVPIEEEPMDNNTDVLRRNGYAVSDGLIETCRGGLWEIPGQVRASRWPHTHLGMVRIDADSKHVKALMAAVVAAVGEPACLVGTNQNGAVLLVFRIRGDSYAFGVRAGYAPPQEQHEFVLDGRQGLFTATADGALLDVAAFSWLNERSPLNTPHYALPPMHPEISQAAFDAVGEFIKSNGGRWGPLVLPESPMEAMLRQAAERKAAGIVPETPEEADQRLVAANPDLRPSDGAQGIRVAQAHARIAEREEAEREERKRDETARNKAKMKALQASLGNAT